MTKALHDKRSLTAILAATLFIVQMMLASWAMAGSAGQQMVDAFGNPICVTSSDGNPAAPLQDHGKLPACCTVGCNAFSPGLPAADPASVSLSLAPKRSASFRLPRPAEPSVGPEHDPGNPRAPPLKD